jgi:hypothetical protein
VCNPRKNALLKDGSKSDQIDARKLAELLRGNHLKPVYHGEQGLRTLKELARSYLIISKDVTRVMNRLKALYRSLALRVPAPKCMHHVTARNGLAGSAKPASGDAPNTANSSWMPYVCCTSRYAGIYCWKARSTRHGDCLA